MQKAVVITGASSGIGEGCALHLDRLGFRVFAGVRKQADGEALRRKASDRLDWLFIDVTDPTSIEQAAQQVSREVGQAGLTGLVNNAGIAVSAPLEFVPIEEFRRQLEINVIGQLAVTQAFLPLLRQARGRIVNMSSISGRVAMPMLGPYAASKFALEALSDSLRVELMPWGIDVICIEPGPVSTPIWDKSLSKADEMARNLPEAGHRLYGDRIESTRKRAREANQKGVPVETVAHRVALALTLNRPKTRYLVGRYTRLAALLMNLLPDRLRDRLVAAVR